MCQDLRSYITETSNDIDDQVSEELLDFIKFFSCSFNISNEFIDALRTNYQDLISEGYLNLDIFSSPQWYLHLSDFLSFNYPPGIHEMDIMSFIMGSLIPKCNIEDVISENYYEGSFDYDSDNMDSEEKKSLLFEHYNSELEKIKDHYEKANLPNEIIIDFNKWLDSDFIDWISVSEFNETNFFSIVVSSEYIYKIFKDNELKEAYSKIFDDWSVCFDEKNKVGYLGYGQLSISDYMHIPLNLNHWKKANNLLKNKFNLEYNIVPEDLINNMKAFDLYQKSGYNSLIYKIMNTFETENEVMF